MTPFESSLLAMLAPVAIALAAYLHSLATRRTVTKALEGKQDKTGA